MFKQPRALLVGVLAAAAVVACTPTTELKGQGGTIKLQLPQNREEFRSMVEEKIHPAVKDGTLTPSQARDFIKSQRSRLSLPNPDQTPGFDAWLKSQGLPQN